VPPSPRRNHRNPLGPRTWGIDLRGWTENGPRSRSRRSICRAQKRRVACQDEVLDRAEIIEFLGSLLPDQKTSPRREGSRLPAEDLLQRFPTRSTLPVCPAGQHESHQRTKGDCDSGD
jgi:hypothetical protein